MAASWDRDLANRVGTEIGRDARSRGAALVLGPGVNIYRAPLNERNFEYFGEDPFLAGEIAVGYIEGVQSQGVSATIKHYAANNSEYFRFTSDSVVSEDHPSVARPPQELKGFTRVMLNPGETRHVTVPLDARSFTWYDTKAAAWHADAGSFTVHVSRSSDDPQLEGKITLDQAIVLPVK